MRRLPIQTKRLKFTSVLMGFNPPQQLANMHTVLANSLVEQIKMLPLPALRSSYSGNNTVLSAVKWPQWNVTTLQTYVEMGSRIVAARLDGGSAVADTWTQMLAADPAISDADNFLTTLIAGLWQRRRVDYSYKALATTCGVSFKAAWAQYAGAPRDIATPADMTPALTNGRIEDTDFGRQLATLSFIFSLNNDTSSLITVTPEDIRSFGAARGMEMDFSSAPSDPRYKLLSMLIVRIRLTHWMISHAYTTYRLWAHLMKPYVASYSAELRRARAGGAELAERFIDGALPRLAEVGSKSPFVEALLQNTSAEASYVEGLAAEPSKAEVVLFPSLNRPDWASVPLSPYSSQNTPTGPDYRTSCLHSLLPLFRAVDSSIAGYKTYDANAIWGGVYDRDCFTLAAAFDEVVKGLPPHCLPTPTVPGTASLGVRHNLRLDAPPGAWTDGERASCDGLEVIGGSRVLSAVVSTTLVSASIEVVDAGAPQASVLPIPVRFPLLQVGRAGYHMHGLAEVNWMGESRVSKVPFPLFAAMTKERDGALPVDLAQEADYLVAKAKTSTSGAFYWKEGPPEAPQWVLDDRSSAALLQTGMFPQAVTAESATGVAPNASLLTADGEEARVYVRYTGMDEDPFLDRITVNYAFGNWYVPMQLDKVMRLTLEVKTRILLTPEVGTELTSDVSVATTTLQKLVTPTGTTTAMVRPEANNGERGPTTPDGPYTEPSLRTETAPADRPPPNASAVAAANEARRRPTTSQGAAPAAAATAPAAQATPPAQAPAAPETPAAAPPPAADAGGGTNQGG